MKKDCSIIWFKKSKGAKLNLPLKIQVLLEFRKPYLLKFKFCLNLQVRKSRDYHQHEEEKPRDEHQSPYDLAYRSKREVKALYQQRVKLARAFKPCKPLASLVLHLALRKATAEYNHIHREAFGSKMRVKEMHRKDKAHREQCLV